MNKVHYAGALNDPVAAAVLCASHNVDLVVVNGKVVVQDGMLCTMNMDKIVKRHNEISGIMMS